MDIYTITPKGSQHRSQMGHMSTFDFIRLPEERKYQDYFLLGSLEEFGPTNYDELVEILVEPREPDPIWPTEADLRQTLRRLFEAGLIDRMER